jgi:hypothetical protein
MLTIVDFFRTIYESADPSNLHSALQILKELRGRQP